MNHLIRYEGYDVKERLNDILDKISKYGISSITDIEKEFLDAHSSHTELEVHDKIKFIENEMVFEDEHFKFEFKKLEIVEDELHIIGKIYVPSISSLNIEGDMDGKIIYYTNGQIVPYFEKTIDSGQSRVTYDIFEFCNGLEYELDNFLDYVVSEVNKK
jgi:hypothetical protein